MTGDGQEKTLSGRNILIVEDELLVAMDLEDTLVEWGFVVVESTSTVERALHAIETHKVDAAILDLNLDGKTTLPVAERLEEGNIPFVIVSGYEELSSTHPALTDVPLVPKPWNRDLLFARLSEVLALHAQRFCASK